MSDRNSTDNLTEQVVTGEEIRNQLSIVEQIRQQFSGDDEYLDALLEGQKLQLMQMAQTQDLIENFSGFGDNSNIPVGRVGRMLEDVTLGQTGDAVFSFGGSPRRVTVRADETLGELDTVQVIDDDNLVEKAKIESLLAGAQGGSLGAMSARAFGIEESEENVTVQPGTTETVLQVNSRESKWVSVGTNDETYTEYQYYVDGEEIVDEPLSHPLGLFNDPYRFPQPLTFRSRFRVDVSRSSEASSPADYFSKATYIDT